MQSSTSRTQYPWLHLNAFRGEPAISMFGWNFSSIHSSSPSFATLVGSSLDGLSHPLHSGHGYLTWFRVASPLRMVLANQRSPSSDSVSLRLQSFAAP